MINSMNSNSQSILVANLQNGKARSRPNVPNDCFRLLSAFFGGALFALIFLRAATNCDRAVDWDFSFSALLQYRVQCIRAIGSTAVADLTTICARRLF